MITAKKILTIADLVDQIAYKLEKLAPNNGRLIYLAAVRHMADRVRREFGDAIAINSATTIGDVIRDVETLKHQRHAETLKDAPDELVTVKRSTAEHCRIVILTNNRPGVCSACDQAMADLEFNLKVKK